MGIREGVGPGRQDAREREGSQERRPRTSQGVLQWLNLRMGPRAAEVGRGQITTALVGSANTQMFSCESFSPDCGPPTSGIVAPWELVRNADSQALPRIRTVTSGLQVAHSLA